MTDFYQLLSVARDCDRDTLHDAFRRISKKYHPDRFVEEQRAAAEKRYEKIVVAFNTLKNPKQRSQYDKKLQVQAQRGTVQQKDPKVLARKYFKAGEACYKARNYEEAIGYFTKANYYCEDAEILYAKSLAESCVPKLHKDAVQSIQKAIRLKPKNPKYSCQLVKYFLEFGFKARARATLENMLQRFPESEELLALAHDVDPKKYKKTGLFGHFFKK